MKNIILSAYYTLAKHKKLKNLIIYVKTVKHVLNLSLKSSQVVLF